MTFLNCNCEKKMNGQDNSECTHKINRLTDTNNKIINEETTKYVVSISHYVGLKTYI